LKLPFARIHERHRRLLPPGHHQIDRAIVVACYRYLLGREPENERAIQEKREIESVAELIRHFTSSSEYRRHSIIRYLRSAYSSLYYKIDYDIQDQRLSALFDRIKQQWARLGDQEPFWSVLTLENYLVANLEDSQVREFYESGKLDADLLNTFETRNEVRISRAICLELGCGVGRVTRHLSGMFSNVFAVDISPGHLEHCRTHLSRQGVSNFAPILINSPEDVRRLPGFDFLISFIVLQHNPPPIQYFMLDTLLSKINHGGGPIAVRFKSLA